MLVGHLGNTTANRVCVCMYTVQRRQRFSPDSDVIAGPDNWRLTMLSVGGRVMIGSRTLAVGHQLSVAVDVCPCSGID